jgi:hypothetical protein
MESVSPPAVKNTAPRMNAPIAPETVRNRSFLAAKAMIAARKIDRINGER